METGERLAAYLAGELDADETAALEAALARDPGLRARLEAIRSTDAALAGLPPVTPPAGFSERLRETLRAELDEQLGGDDELATRRARRRGTTGTRSWWPQVAVAAAVLAVAGIGLTQLVGGSGGDDAPVAGSAEESADAMIAAAPPVDGPTVVAVGRSFDAETLRELADDARFDEVIARGLDRDTAADTAEDYASTLRRPEEGADGGADAGVMADAPATESAPLETATGEAAGTGDVGLRTVGDVSPEDLEAVRACLPSLLEAETAVIPVYAELVAFDGQAAIVYGLVGNDPAEERYSRVELWVLGRSDCQTLHFTQVDR